MASTAPAQSQSFSEWFATQSQAKPASEGSSVGSLQPPAPAPSAASQLMSFFTTSQAMTLDPEVGGGGGGGSGGSTPPPSTQPSASGVNNLAASFTGALALLPAVMRVGPLAAALGGGAPSPGPTEAPEWTCGMNAGQRFQAFGILLVTSLMLYIAAIFVFLPMVIFMPSKFATTFTFASIAWMAAFAILRGPRATLLSLVSDKDKRVFTLAYVSSLLMTLYFTIFTSSYLLALLAIIVQVSAMMWYMSSSIPGGTAAMGALSRWCFGSLTSYLPVPMK